MNLINFPRIIRQIWVSGLDFILIIALSRRIPLFAAKIHLTTTINNISAKIDGTSNRNSDEFLTETRYILGQIILCWLYVRSFLRSVIEGHEMNPPNSTYRFLPLMAGDRIIDVERYWCWFLIYRRDYGRILLVTGVRCKWKIVCKST